MLGELDNLKDEEVIIHCRSGKRSAAACSILDMMGFTKTVNLEGGVLHGKMRLIVDSVTFISTFISDSNKRSKNFTFL